MREIPEKKRLEVLKLYFKGYSYDEIAKATVISKGSVVNILRELKEGGYPELENVVDFVDELRGLAIEFKKTGLAVPQALIGLRIYERLQSIGVDPQAIEDYVKMCNRISPPDFPVKEFISAAVRLHHLEEELGKGYDEALKCLENELREKSSELAELSSQVEAMNREKARLRDELVEVEAELKKAKARLDELAKGSESLEKLGVEKVSRLSRFIHECEKLGYSTERLEETIKLVREKESLERQRSALRNELAGLNQKIRQAKREMLDTIAESGRLKALDKVLKEHTTKMTCSYCRGPLTVPIPPIWELEDAMRRGLIYPVRCYYCGYTNQITAHDILASIAWKILKA